MARIYSSSPLRQSLDAIESEFSDAVMIRPKILTRFGRNLIVGTAFETVAEFQGATANETFVTTNIIDSIVSSSAGDITQAIVIDGHTIDGSGNLTFVTQDAILDGQSEVALAISLARVDAAYVKASGIFGTDPAALIGIVSIYDNTDGITAGVPNTAAATKLTIPAGDTQGHKAATSMSSTDYWIITEFDAGVGNAGGAANRITVRMEIRDVPNGGAWLPMFGEIVLVVGQDATQEKFLPPLIVPKNHDWRIVAKSDSNTAEVFAAASGYLASSII